MFLDTFNVLFDVLGDYVNYQSIMGAAYPVAVVLILTVTIVFAWRSTEVSTDDDVQGQFTIPGRGTFNVINPTRPSSATRRPNSTTPPAEPISEESEPLAEESFEAGDEEESEVTINVRYLDESVKSCRFRPSQSLGHFKQLNWTETTERQRVCLIYAGKALRDDRVRMSRIGLKEGDTMHAFYRNVEERNNNQNGESSSSQSTSTSATASTPEGDDFDELARYFLPLAGSLLVMTWFYVLSSPIMLSVSTLVALLFITLIYTGFAVYNFRSTIF